MFAKMLSDKSIIDLKKLGYKYPQADLKEFAALLGNGFYKPLPLKDFNGRNLAIWTLLPRSRYRQTTCC